MKYSSLGRRSIVEKLTSFAKGLARIPLLVTALLLSNSPATATNAAPVKKSINERVELVRNTLKRKTSNDQTPANSFSYSETRLAQWGNWGNWGNWLNWNNWNNWNNWRNWGNWGNWPNV